MLQTLFMYLCTASRLLRDKSSPERLLHYKKVAFEFCLVVHRTLLKFAEID